MRIFLTVKWILFFIDRKVLEETIIKNLHDKPVRCRLPGIISPRR
jgi:hypothetical protein